MEETFSPPFIKGQVIVAFTVSSSFSSIVELKSLFSDFETFIEAEGEGKDVFVHITAVQAAGLSNLQEETVLTYDLEDGPNGKSSAVNLKVEE